MDKEYSVPPDRQSENGLKNLVTGEITTDYATIDMVIVKHEACQSIP